MKKDLLKKDLLKRLIVEVIKEVEAMTEPTVADKDPENLVKHSMAAPKKQSDLTLVLQLKGIRPNRSFKKLLKKIAYDAKMADLEAIHAQIQNKAGKTLASVERGELSSTDPEDVEDYDTGPAKSVTRTTSKEKPPMKGGPEDWKSMEKTDLQAQREKAKKRFQLSKAGKLQLDPTDPTHQRPADTELWTDDDWRSWEKHNPPKPGEKHIFNIGDEQQQQ